MKKGVLAVLVIVLSAQLYALETTVSPRLADEPFPPPARITKFETDNVHILRLQNFTRAVVEEVDQLESEFDVLNVQLNRIKLQLDELQNARSLLPQANYDGQLADLSIQLSNLQQDVRSLNIQGQSVRDVQKDGSIPALLVMMVFLFGMLGIVMVWVRNKMHNVDEEKHAAMHAKFHLTNYLKHSVEKGESISSLRKHFTNQGWSNERFDEALEQAMRKE
ncbi:MAG: hypothetical protein HY363_04935 [Candidatus Aenigmarchaeota archaeon]|nr:hypothetical protein [Candidatus Aenigmarchaeota archaeon]